MSRASVYVAHMDKNKGIFLEPRHKWLADIVSFENPEKAERSAERLVSALKNKKIQHNGKIIKIGQKRALTILRSITEAYNRAKASLNRKNLSAKERREYERIAKIYERAKEEAKVIYREKYKGVNNAKKKGGKAKTKAKGGKRRK